MRSKHLTWTFLTKAYPLGDITYCSPVPSGRIFSIETIISWLLVLEQSFYAWPMGSWFPSVPGSLTGGLSVLIGTLSLTTRYSSEYLGPLTDFDSDPLNLHKIFFLAFLKCVNCSSAFNHSSYNYGSSYLSNITCILEFLDVTSLIQTSGYVAVLITTVDNMSSNTTWYCGN